MIKHYAQTPTRNRAATASAVVARADLGFAIGAGLLLVGAVLALVCLNESRPVGREAGHRRFGRERTAQSESVAAERHP